MKQKREYSDYLQDILDAISKIDKFTEGMDADRFLADEKTVFAVIRALEIIGEVQKNYRVRCGKNIRRLPGAMLLACETNCLMTILALISIGYGKLCRMTSPSFAMLQ
jgi:hypothetical protein